MRLEDYDVRDESVLDMTREEADQLRAEQERDAKVKAERRQWERTEFARGMDAARRTLAERAQAELAQDIAWARTVLVQGETFASETALYCTLHNARKACEGGRTLTYSTIARLRRVRDALTPELVNSNVKVPA